jgi:hypothetical protein
MSVTQSIDFRRVMVYPPTDVTAGSASNAGNAYVTIYNNFTFDDPTDNYLPITSQGVTTLYKYEDEHADPQVTTSYATENAMVISLCDQLWYGTYTGSLDPPV